MRSRERRYHDVRCSSRACQSTGPAGEARDFEATETAWVCDKAKQIHPSISDLDSLGKVKRSLLAMQKERIAIDREKLRNNEMDPASPA